jgi:hypothetical protein
MATSRPRRGRGKPAWVASPPRLLRVSPATNEPIPHSGILPVVDDAPEIAVLQLPKFKADATELIGADGIEAVAVYLIGRPEAGDVIPGSGGVRKLRWAAKGKGKRGGARIIYLYVVIAARIYLMRCYAKNTKTDLTQNEKKQLRQIALHLKGAN